MADLLFVAVLLAFFAVAFVVVKACERIIGPDEITTTDVATDEERLAA